METADNNKRIDMEMNHLRNDPSFLIESIHEKIMHRIEEINSAAASEMKKIDEDLRVELENFRRAQQETSDKRIQFEEAKVQNLTSIEMKKQKLEIMESFINNVISSAASELRADNRYRSFLKECILNGLKEVKGGSATVLISPEDHHLYEKLTEEITGVGYNLNVKILPDPRAGIGGALVIDDETEVVYNNSVERIIYRNNGDIRREILRSLKEYSSGDKQRV